MSGCVLFSATTNPWVEKADRVRTAPMARRRAGRTGNRSSQAGRYSTKLFGLIAIWSPARRGIGVRARHRQTFNTCGLAVLARAYPDLFHFELQHRRQWHDPAETSGYA